MRPQGGILYTPRRVACALATGRVVCRSRREDVEGWSSDVVNRLSVAVAASFALRLLGRCVCACSRRRISVVAESLSHLPLGILGFRAYWITLPSRGFICVPHPPATSSPPLDDGARPRWALARGAAIVGDRKFNALFHRNARESHLNIRCFDVSPARCATVAAVAFTPAARDRTAHLPACAPYIRFMLSPASALIRHPFACNVGFTRPAPAAPHAGLVRHMLFLPGRRGCRFLACTLTLHRAGLAEL